MSQLHLYAINVDEVRDMFGAADPLATRLRDIAREKFFATKASGLLGSLGPLFRRPPYRPESPSDPTPEVTELVVAGHYVAPEDLRRAWTLVAAWLDELAWGAYSQDTTAADFERFEFDLACAGLSSDFSLGTVLRRDASLPLAPLPGMRLGYVRHAHALAMAAHLDAVNSTSAEAAALDRWLDSFEAMGRHAADAQRPLPDLLAWWLD